MDTSVQTRTAGAAVVLAGAWVAFSPLVINMSSSAMWNAIIVGGLLTLTGVGQLVLRAEALGVLGILLTLWLGVSVLVIDHTTAAIWSVVVAGLVGFLGSLWEFVASQEDIGSPRMSHPV